MHDVADITVDEILRGFSRLSPSFCISLSMSEKTERLDGFSAEEFWQARAGRPGDL